MTPSAVAMAKPSPLCSARSRRSGRTSKDIVRPGWRRMRCTVPTASPIDLGASIEDQLPRLPSRKSSVYPRLKVLAVSGSKPPVTVPYEARQ